MPRVLLLHANGEDYLTDTLLHGLREVLGPDLVDVPRRDALYADLPEERRQKLYGRGFSLYARLPEVEVDRDWPLRRAIEGEFDAVVLADVWRNHGPWVALRPHLKTLKANGTKLIACDGGDGPVLYPHGPTWWKQMRPWPLPRVHGRADQTFKRELTETTARVRYLGLLPGPTALKRLQRHVAPIGFSIPAEHLATGDEPKTQLLATHVTDPELHKLLGRPDVKYAFDREADYYADLRASKFGSTGKKAGWDALRHYEVAAGGCVPVFQHLARKPATAAPLGLVDGVNAVGYDDAHEVLPRLEAMDDATYARLRAGALDWARQNTTRARALQVLASVGL